MTILMIISNTTVYMIKTIIKFQQLQFYASYMYIINDYVMWAPATLLQK